MEDLLLSVFSSKQIHDSFEAWNTDIILQESKAKEIATLVKEILLRRHNSELKLVEAGLIDAPSKLTCTEVKVLKILGLGTCYCNMWCTGSCSRQGSCAYANNCGCPCCGPPCNAGCDGDCGNECCG